MNYKEGIVPSTVLHWNYRGFTEFPIHKLHGDETDVTDIYLKENLISRLPSDIGRLERLESLYLSGNDITELPGEISQLRCLKCLDVSGNRLRRIPEEIGEIRSLKFLILDDNELIELPLRLGELRFLQYLSVCDNKLRWLPQRPVYNYHHCEFRFWRNTDLKTIPYSLWFHMLRDQQTRSLNIGCLSVPQYQHLLRHGRCRLKLQYSSRVWEIDVESPPHHANIYERGPSSPVTLSELCKRKFYQVLRETTRSMHNECLSIYADNSQDIDVNNNLEVRDSATQYKDGNLKRTQIIGKYRPYGVPSDLIEEYFDYLPRCLKYDLCTGPVSNCENVICKRPIFDFVTYEFCLGKIILIDNTEDVILSAAFCSQNCANIWKGGKTNTIIPWVLCPQPVD